jgi:hypothetical protein
MPYIEQSERYNFDKLLDLFDDFNEGQLNYIITRLCRKYIEKNGEKYKNYNALIGALECAKFELYRRRISKYEDVKIIENGDVY